MKCHAKTCLVFSVFILLYKCLNSFIPCDIYNTMRGYQLLWSHHPPVWLLHHEQSLQQVSLVLVTDLWTPYIILHRDNVTKQEWNFIYFVSHLCETSISLHILQLETSFKQAMQEITGDGQMYYICLSWLLGAITLWSWDKLKWHCFEIKNVQFKKEEHPPWNPWSHRR